MEIGNTLYTVLIVLGGASCLFLVIAALYQFVFTRKSRDEHLRASLKTLRARYGDFSERLNLLDRHTSSYMHSISSDGLAALRDSRKIMGLMDSILEELEEMFVQGDYYAVEELQLFLNKRTDGLSRRWSREARTCIVELQDWDIRLEQSIQLVGRDIAVASQRMSQVRVSGQRKRRPTSMSLQEARVHLDIEEGGVEVEEGEDRPHHEH